MESNEERSTEEAPEEGGVEPPEGAIEGDQGEQVPTDGQAGFDPSRPVATSAPAPDAQSGTPGETPGGVNDPEAEGDDEDDDE